MHRESPHLLCLMCLSVATVFVSPVYFRALLSLAQEEDFTHIRVIHGTRSREWFVRRTTEVAQARTANVSNFREGFSRVVHVAGEDERPCLGHFTA